MSSGGGKHFADWLLGWAHRVPHFDFRFRRLGPETAFDVDANGEYAQSLVILCACCLLLALLFLLATVIVWVTQCCIARRSSGPHRTSRRRCGRLSCALFLVSVLCFGLMGGCLFGNELLNKSVQSSLDGLGHLGDGLRQALIQTQKLNQSQWQLTQHVDELTVLIERKSREQKDINQTQIREADGLLTELSDKVDELKQRLARTSAILADTHFLDISRRKGDRVEFERWLLCLILQLIMCAVLFAGVIAFCRQSRKGAIIFSGLGLAIFLVSWLLFSIVFPLTVAHADFCSDGRPFLRSRLNDELLDLVQFYSDCSPEDGLPPALPLGLMGQLAQEQARAEQRLETLLARMFNRNGSGSGGSEEELDTLARQTQGQLLASHRLLGALQFGLQCGHLHRDVHGMRVSYCRHAFIGSALVSAGLLLLGLTLFVLLILVAKSWYMFTRLPNEYLEVGEEDQFSPRCHDAMPDNIYDTNIFNPRARQHLNTAAAVDGGGGGVGPSSADRMPSNGGLAHHQQSSHQPLLLGGDRHSANGGASWQQQMLAHNAAMASAPPPGGTLPSGATLRLLGGGGGGTLSRNGGGIRSANYQQMNGVSPYGRFQEFGDA